MKIVCWTNVISNFYYGYIDYIFAATFHDECYRDIAKKNYKC